MLDKMNNNSIIPPPHLLEIYSTSTASHWQKRTSLYAFASEFRRCRNSLLFNTSGIRAAVANPQRIKDTPALDFQLTPCICTVYFQKAFFAIDNASTASSISKRLFLHYTAHLVRCCSQINPHRIKISINGCKNINSG